MKTWKRLRGIVRAGGYVLLVDGASNGWWISAAQHPTALRPYIVHRPDGEAIGPNYHSVVEAKAALIVAFEAEVMRHGQA